MDNNYIETLPQLKLWGHKLYLISSKKNFVQVGLVLLRRRNIRQINPLDSKEWGVILYNKLEFTPKFFHHAYFQVVMFLTYDSHTKIKHWNALDLFNWLRYPIIFACVSVINIIMTPTFHVYATGHWHRNLIVQSLFLNLYYSSRVVVQKQQNWNQGQYQI